MLWSALFTSSLYLWPSSIHFGLAVTYILAIAGGEGEVQDSDRHCSMVCLAASLLLSILEPRDAGLLTSAHQLSVGLAVKTTLRNESSSRESTVCYFFLAFFCWSVVGYNQDVQSIVANLSVSIRVKAWANVVAVCEWMYVCMNIVNLVFALWLVLD